MKDEGSPWFLWLVIVIMWVQIFRLGGKVKDLEEHLAFAQSQAAAAALKSQEAMSLAEEVQMAVDDLQWR